MAQAPASIPTPAGPTLHFVAIGASGSEGLKEIKELLAALPCPLPAVVMVVLHRLVDQVSRLREILAAVTPMKVIVAREGERLIPGCVYIGEPDEHLTLIDTSSAHLLHGSRNEYRNRTIDALLQSLATYAGSSTIGVILSGALDDGACGLAAIHRAMGVTMVLTPDRAHAPGMPEHAIDFDGPVDVIGSPAVVARAIARLLSAPAAAV